MRRIVFSASPTPESRAALHVGGQGIAPQDYRRYLGREYSSLFWDASAGLFPNAFAALAPCLKAEGTLWLYLPEHDADHPRLADAGTDLAACQPRFNQRLRRLVQLYAWNAAAAPTALHASDLAFYADSELLLGKRGCGKTTYLTRKIKILQEQGEGIIAACSEEGMRQHWREVMHTCGVAPPALLAPEWLWQQRPAADHLFIDEIASYPQDHLLALSTHYRQISLAGTDEGYEGSARIFQHITLPALQRARPDLLLRRCAYSYRHPDADTFERCLHQIFFPGDATLATLSPTPATPAPPRIRALDQDELTSNETLLAQIMNLLQQAHYRHRPEDLKRLLDLPRQKLWIMQEGAQMVGVLHLVREETLPADLAQSVIDGRRRPRGRLLMQQMLIHTRDPRYAAQPQYRVQRIVIHPERRRRAWASQLLRHALNAEGIHAYGVSFAHQASTEAFWRSQGLQRVYLSEQRRARSGLPSCLMYKDVFPSKGES